MKRSCLVIFLSVAIVGCNSRATTAIAVPSAKTSDEPQLPTLLEDVTLASGIEHTYRNGEEADNYAIPESLGGGVALFDFDGDGLLDVYFTGGGYFEGKTLRGVPGKLYRNLGNLKFKDVTKDVGLDEGLLYAHAIAVADYDCDGWPDLLITGYGKLLLYHNEPDGKGGRKFVNVAAKAGLNAHLWSSSAAWGDLDGDGYPDIYVCQYGDWSFERNHPTDCFYIPGKRDVCPPRKFKALPHKIYRNNRDGTFADMSDTIKMRDDGKGLGVVMVDVNNDQKPDIYATNDTDDNFLYMNRGTGGKLAFEEKGLAAGVARDEGGRMNGSMGTDAADYDGSGRASLWCTNYQDELHALYRNDCVDKREFFLYATYASGIARIGQNYVGWGTSFADLDHHGWEDLVIAHGHAIRFPAGAAGRRELPLLLRNEKGKFTSMSKRGGSYFQDLHNARGLALGDLDNDGKIDVVVSHLNEPVAVLHNVAPDDNHWVGFTLVGKNKRDLVGSRVVVESGGRKQTRFHKGGGSYASTSDRRHIVGLGATNSIDKVTVYWSWGGSQSWTNISSDRYWRLIEGEENADEVKKP